MRVIAALDIGGTSTRISLRDTAGKELHRKTVTTAATDYRQALNTIRDQLAQLTHPRTLGTVGELAGVGVGVAGNICNGTLTGSGNLPGWRFKPIRSDLEAVLSSPVDVINDCAAAALGEYSSLKRPLIYVIWGTGIGASVVYDLEGRADVRPTELGHMIIDRHSTARCGCGGRGHLEALVSGGNMQQRFGIPAEELNTSQWIEVLTDMAAGLHNIASGDMGLPIILGGGIALKQQRRLPLLQEMVRDLASPFPAPELSVATHGEESGLVGAAYVARQLAQRN